MKSWAFLIHSNTGEVTGQLVCGECASNYFQEPEVQEIRNPREHYSDNCSICGKNMGDYYYSNQRKAA
jgi:hypothetical protein